MLRWFWGMWRKRENALTCKGHSNETGFELTIYHMGKGVSYFSTKGYSRADTPSWYRGYLWAALILVTVAVEIWLANFLNQWVGLSWNKNISGWILTFFQYGLEILAGLSTILCFAFFMNYFLQEMREWHACEHKSAVVLKAGLMPTIENLRRYSGVAELCGSAVMLLSLQILWGSLLSIILSPEATTSPWPRVQPLVADVFALWGLGAVILLISSFLGNPWPRTKLFFLLFPAAILSLVVQKYYALKEPSEEKLRQTAEELASFVRKHGLTKEVETI